MDHNLKELINKFLGVFIVFTALSLLLSFVSFVDLSNTGLGGFIDRGSATPENKEPELPIKKIPFSYEEANIQNLSEISDPPQIPVFFVEGLNKDTNHLRLFTSSNYQNGWIKDKPNYKDSMTSSGGKITRYSVTPIIPFTEHIPVAKDTFMVTAEARYNADTGTYLIEVENISSKYTGFSSSSLSHSDSVATATNAEKDLAESMDKLDIEESDKIRELTLEVTKNAENDFQKAKMIEQYLYNNYEYRTDPWFSNTNTDTLIYTFLFVEKKGICKHFASAFIAMCRSIDLPARAVFGYLAKPVNYNQTVFANQAHMWAEVRFEEGWIEFDPTPPMRRVSTQTEITYIDEKANSGSNFTVKGKVTGNNGIPGGYVEIYLKKDKREEGTLVDVIPLDNGRFSANVVAPNISGEYHVIGHYVGSLTHYDSWSDPLIRIYSPPAIKSNLPEKTGMESKIRGAIYDYNGTKIKDSEIILKINGKTVNVTTAKNGTFYFPIRFNQAGFHEVELYYPGHKYILPVSEKKEVEVGEIGLSLNNNSLIRGENWNSSGFLSFNEEPLDTLIEFREIQFDVYPENGEIQFDVEVPENVPLGNIPIKYSLPELNYDSYILLSIKARTEIDVSVKKDSGYTVLVHLKDDKQNPISGELNIYNHTVIAENGIARLEIDELPAKFTVSFIGNDKYLPSSKEVDMGGFPYWVLTLPLIIAAILSYKLRRQRFIFFEIILDEAYDSDFDSKNSSKSNSAKLHRVDANITKRWFNFGSIYEKYSLYKLGKINVKRRTPGVEKDVASPLPAIWDIEEDVRIRVVNKGKGVVRVFLDGEGIGVDKSPELKLKFKEHGNHILKAERIENGEVKENAQLEIKIMNYRDAVVEVFGDFVKNLEKKSEINLKGLTAREIAKKLSKDSSKSRGKEKSKIDGSLPDIPANRMELISIFEVAKYGYSCLTRKDFLRAYNICSRIKEEFR